MTTWSRMEEVPACSYDGTTWVWVHGHVDKRKFKGQLLKRSLPYSDVDLDPSKVVRLNVHHGYVHYVESGYDEMCDTDVVVHFSDGVAPEPDRPRAFHIEPATWSEVSAAIW